MILSLLIGLGCGTAVDTVVDTAPTTPSPVTDQPLVCPVYNMGRSVGQLDISKLDEASGVAASESHDGLFWTHNDSGGSAKLYGFYESGVAVGPVVVQNATAVDWEDISRGRAGSNTLYIGDIGDNDELRESITVYRVDEPNPANLSDPVAEAFTLNYPDGAHNAETLIIDPLTGDLFIVTKHLSGSSVYVARAPLDSTQTLDLQKVADLNTNDWGGSPLITGGDVSDDGLLIALRTYNTVFLWHRNPSKPLESAFSSAPCDEPCQGEVQGEAIAFYPGAKAYLTISEGKGQPIYRYDLAQ